jgi:SAM-dependent methyltransferase
MSDERPSWEDAVVAFRSRPENAALAKDCFYDDPLDQAAKRYAASSEWAAVKEWLPRPAGRALDVGSGRGISAFALACEGWSVTALEPDASDVVGAGAIRWLVQKTSIPIQVIQQPGERLPFEDATFELVHCRAVLHHANDLGLFCREAARVLVPGGHLVALREHVISRPTDLPIFLAGHPLHHLYGGEHAYLLNEYRRAIEASGLQMTRVIGPWASDANLFPETLDRVRERLADRMRWPWPTAIPKRLVAWLGDRLDTPGRLYSFLAHKSVHA